jgi:SAM-dependent methyltransferase
MTSPQTADERTTQRDAFANRLFQSAITTMELYTVYLGDRLGLYRALAEAPGLSAAALAERSGTHERYVHEWLEQQAASGLIAVDDAGADPAARRYHLPAGHDEVLLDRDSLSYLSGLVRLVVGVASPLPAVLAAFREGGGVPYPDYGHDTREGIAEMNRPLFVNLLGREWLPAIPSVHARLQAAAGARVADVGCGTGWSAIAIARAYPNVAVDGFDADEASIARARDHAAAEELGDRVRFYVQDASDPSLSGRYDLVTAFETIHDMARPVDALRQMRALLADGGSVLVADERVGERFSAPGDDVERLNYGFSVLHCLPVGMAETPSAGTGTVMRPPTLRAYAREAGFGTVELLPIEHDFWQFYHLVP